MLTPEKLNRINVLARKAKTSELTKAEKTEQQALRQEYLQAFRGQMLEHLKSVKIVDECGNDVTPEKLKLLKKQSSSLQQ